MKKVMTKEQRYALKQIEMGRRARRMWLTDSEFDSVRVLVKELREAEESQQS